MPKYWCNFKFWNLLHSKLIFWQIAKCCRFWGRRFFSSGAACASRHLFTAVPMPFKTQFFIAFDSLGSETIYSNKIFIKCVHRSAERRRVCSPPLSFHNIDSLRLLLTLYASRLPSLFSHVCVKVHAAGKIDFRGLLTSIIYVAPKGLRRRAWRIAPASSSSIPKLKFFLQEGSEKWKWEPARLLICIQIPFKYCYSVRESSPRKVSLY